MGPDPTQGGHTSPEVARGQSRDLWIVLITVICALVIAFDNQRRR